MLLAVPKDRHPLEQGQKPQDCERQYGEKRALPYHECLIFGYIGVKATVIYQLGTNT